MINFSRQGFTQFFRSAAAMARVCTISVLLTSAAWGQGSDELFRGTWQIDTPEQGALIILVKNQGRASYFWGDNTDRTVYQGTWTSEENAATLTWPDGSRHRIERDDLGFGFGISYTDPSGRERYTAQAQQVPSEILGQWAKPPTKASELASDRDKAKGFFGVWRIGEDEAGVDYVFVEADRSAASTEGGKGLRGSWAKQGSELHIAWDSGDYSILRESRREFAYKRIEPGTIIEDDATEMRPAIRTIEERVPAEWMAHYREERERHTGGIAFSSRQVARDFYRGDWIVQMAASQFERIGISRFGGLSTTAERGLAGDWRMQGQDIFMRWDNGMRKILSPVGHGFLLYEYKPGRPLDGVPSRIRPAAPADSSKLAEHLKGREDVARQMIQLAEAAGIDPSQHEGAGWGRTFARWAWPFGEDKASSPEALLQEEYETSRETDPWWWPFWTEKAATGQKETETDTSGASEAIEGEIEAETVPAVEESITAAPEATMEPDEGVEANTPTEPAPQATEKKRSSARDWVWPF